MTHMICQYCSIELTSCQRICCPACRNRYHREARLKVKIRKGEAVPRVSAAELVDIFKQNGLWYK